MENNMVKKYGKEMLDNWGNDRNDFIADNEVTVTITLREYRELVKSHAVKEADVNRANRRSVELEEENKALKKELDYLHSLTRKNAEVQE